MQTFTLITFFYIYIYIHVATLDKRQKKMENFLIIYLNRLMSMN
jgi:hypothetical protein